MVASGSIAPGQSAQRGGGPQADVAVAMSQLRQQNGKVRRGVTGKVRHQRSLNKNEAGRRWDALGAQRRAGRNGYRFGRDRALQGQRTPRSWLASFAKRVCQLLKVRMPLKKCRLRKPRTAFRPGEARKTSENAVSP